jgi:hypothetical protein
MARTKNATRKPAKRPRMAYAQIDTSPATSSSSSSEDEQQDAAAVQLPVLPQPLVAVQPPTDAPPANVNPQCDVEPLGPGDCPMCPRSFKQHTSVVRHMGIEHGCDGEGRPLTEEQREDARRRSRKVRKTAAQTPASTTKTRKTAKKRKTPPSATPPASSTSTAAPPSDAPPASSSTAPPAPMLAASPASPAIVDISDSSPAASVRTRRSVRLRELGLDVSTDSQSLPSTSTSPDRRSVPLIVDSRASTPVQDEPHYSPPPRIAVESSVRRPQPAPQPLVPNVIIQAMPATGVPTRIDTVEAAAAVATGQKRHLPAASKDRAEETAGAPGPSHRRPSPPKRATAPDVAPSTSSAPQPSTSAAASCRRIAGSLLPTAIVKRGKSQTKKVAAGDPCVRHPTQPAPIYTPPARPAKSGATHHVAPARSNDRSVPRDPPANVAAGPRTRLTHSALYREVRLHPREDVAAIADRLAAQMAWSVEERRLHQERLYDIRRAVAATLLDEKNRIPFNRAAGQMDAYLDGLDRRLDDAHHWSDTMDEH